jgi:hypothetical protein
MWTVHTSEAGSLLFGQVGRLEWDLILPVGALIGVGALGIWAIVKVKKWRVEEAEEQIDHYQKMVDEGMLDPQELARIKAQLVKEAHRGGTANDLTPPATGQPPDTSIRET